MGVFISRKCFPDVGLIFFMLSQISLKARLSLHKIKFESSFNLEDFIAKVIDMWVVYICSQIKLYKLFAKNVNF